MENRRSKDDEVSGRVWKAVETSTGKIGVEEAERRRSKGRSRQKKRRKGEKEKAEERENNGNKKDSRRVGNMG